MKFITSFVKSSIAIWNKTSENPKAPVMSGVVKLTRQDVVEMYKKLGDAAGVELNIALWMSPSENPKAPAFTGTVTLENKVAAIKASPEVKKEAPSAKPKKVIKSGTGEFSASQMMMLQEMMKNIIGERITVGR